MVRDKRMASPGTPCEQEGPSHCCPAWGPQEVPQLPPQVVILKRGDEFTALQQYSEFLDQHFVLMTVSFSSSSNLQEFLW